MTAVTGRCVDASGTPVPGAYVYAYPTTGGRFGGAVSTHSRADGWWWLDLPPGQWMVRETGHAAHNLLVSDQAVDTTPEAMAQVAEQPTREDVERLLSRRKQNAQEPQPPEADTTTGIAALLSRRRRRADGHPE